MRIIDWSSDVCSSDLEEPRNMGAWSFIEPNLEWVLTRTDGTAARARYVGRPPSASTAAGLMTKHVEEQKALVNEALTRSEEHTSELQSLMRISYAVFCLKKKTRPQETHNTKYEHKKRENQTKTTQYSEY